jgi:hypothetical protein
MRPLKRGVMQKYGIYLETVITLYWYLLICA